MFWCSLSRPPPREEAKALISRAFPRADLGPTVLVEAGLFVHSASFNFSFRACFLPSTPGNLVCSKNHPMCFPQFSNFLNARWWRVRSSTCGPMMWLVQWNPPDNLKHDQISGSAFCVCIVLVKKEKEKDLTQGPSSWPSPIADTWRIFLLKRSPSRGRHLSDNGCPLIEALDEYSQINFETFIDSCSAFRLWWSTAAHELVRACKSTLLGILS